MSIARLAFAGLLLLVLFSFVRAAEPLRLGEVSIVRFVETAPGEWWIKHGLLDARGAFRETDTWPVLSTVVVPAAALNKNLISFEAWLAYERLGPVAVENFFADTEGSHHLVGQRIYLEIASSPQPKLSRGQLLNLSSRGWVSPEVGMIGGFVIDAQHRRVLLRVAGPSLAAAGVPRSLPDPAVTIYRGATALHTNDNWGDFSDQPALAQAAAAVGAAPFLDGSKDAALLVELPPGIYTADVRSQTAAAGEVVLEIYSVPE